MLEPNLMVIFHVSRYCLFHLLLIFALASGSSSQEPEDNDEELARALDASLKMGSHKNTPNHLTPYYYPRGYMYVS